MCHMPGGCRLLMTPPLSAWPSPGRPRTRRAAARLGAGVRVEHARDRGHRRHDGPHPVGQPRVRGDARRTPRRLRRPARDVVLAPGVAGQGRRARRGGSAARDTSGSPTSTPGWTAACSPPRPRSSPPSTATDGRCTGSPGPRTSPEQAGGRGRASRDRRDVRGGVRLRAQRRRHDRARRALPARQRGAVRHARPHRGRARRASDDRGLPSGRPRRDDELRTRP